MANVNINKKRGAAAEEALNALRGNLMLRFPEVRAVCLVGERPYADKLALARGLAERFAALEKRTLFVECVAIDRPAPADWRADGPALADYLAGKAELPKIVRKVSDCLDAIPCGAASRISELIARERMDALMAEARERYDFIIVDATSMATCADAAMAARRCDGALLLAEYHETRGDALKRAQQDLERNRIKLLGVVVAEPEKPEGNVTRILRKIR